MIKLLIVCILQQFVMLVGSVERSIINIAQYVNMWINDINHVILKTTQKSEN